MLFYQTTTSFATQPLNVQYPIVEEKRSSPGQDLVGLLGGFQMEQRVEDFYSFKGIWVDILMHKVYTRVRAFQLITFCFLQHLQRK